MWAATGKQEYGAVMVEGSSVDQPVTIRIGQGLGAPAVAQASLTTGQLMPSLTVVSLDGAAATWNAAADDDRLVVIGALWHPATKALIAKAKIWCNDKGKPLQVVSLDWSLEQARRESEAMRLSGQTLFAGPGTLALSEQWWLPGDRVAMLVGKDGTVISRPLE